MGLGFDCNVEDGLLAKAFRAAATPAPAAAKATAAGLRNFIQERNVLFLSSKSRLLPGLAALGDEAARTIVLLGRDPEERRRAAATLAGLRSWTIAEIDEDTLSVDNLRRYEAGILEAELERDGTRAVIQARSTSAKKDVVIVGAGVVGLLTAYEARRAGYDVHVIEAAPHPDQQASWTRFGCSMGGANARMFTMNEGRVHTLRFLADGSQVDYFGTTLDDKGWVARRESLSEHAGWHAEFAHPLRFMQAVYEDDTIAVNRRSFDVWNRLRSEAPSVFDGTGVIDGILRLYATEAQWQAARLRESEIGAALSALPPSAVADRYPVLAPAVRQGAVAGGIEVKGFSIGIHAIVRNLVAELERSGVTFSFDTRVDGVVQGAAGEVQGLTVAGRDIRPTNIVFATGAYGNAALADTGLEDRIHSVFGVWVELPMTDPVLPRSIKYTRNSGLFEGAAEGANIIATRNDLGQPCFYVSTGHAHVGTDPQHPPLAARRLLFEETLDVARRLFPDRAPDIERQARLADADIRCCVRPWGTNCLGLFAVRPTAGGGLFLVATGHNTGGFAQAPGVADAVVRTLGGEFDPMVLQFHPRRVQAFQNHHDRVTCHG